MKLRQAVVLLIGLGLGAAGLVVARDGSTASLAGDSLAAGLLGLATGTALLACGLIAWSRRPASRFGAILAVAGAAWFVVELNNPAVGSAVLFTFALVAYAACPALVAHAAFAYPDGRVRGRLVRAGLALAYASTLLVLGLVSAIAFDPAGQGCLECPRNLLHVAGSPGLVEALGRAGLIAGVVWAAVLAALALLRAARSSPAARRLTGPVLLALAAYLGFVAATYAHGIGRGFQSNDEVDRQLWAGQAAALLTLTVGVALAWVRGLRARTSVARLVIELGEAGAPGQLRDALRRALDDPALELAYPLGPLQYVDADGRSMQLPDADGRAVTPFVRGGRPVALLLHKADLRDDPGLVEEVGAAAGLALEHERLQAHARAQLEQLRASRARTVAAGDAERRRLERDLHDGAQQRLVVLAFAFALLRAELAGRGTEQLDAAEVELRAALGELRELARGIYPAVLIDEGLASALESLAETGSAPLALTALPEERFEPAVEAAAYFLVAEVVRRARDTPVSVCVTRTGGRLLVEVRGAVAADGELIELEDRIGALDGELSVQRTPAGMTTILAEVPCGS